MLEKTCCFTGHRQIPEYEFDVVKYKLREEIIKLISRGVIYYGAGGAIGFDTLAAQTVLELREKYQEVRLILILPCKNQAERWNIGNKKIYTGILEKADKTVYLAERYYNGCMQKRNRYLIDNSRYCICYLRHNKGGTFYTVSYAQKQKIEIIKI